MVHNLFVGLIELGQNPFQLVFGGDQLRRTFFAIASIACQMAAQCLDFLFMLIDQLCERFDNSDQWIDLFHICAFPEVVSGFVAFRGAAEST
ncbi:MAG: hypothetical protein KA004_18080 [Verrucomicrobiales bacterium]|nr:hypothetical protein [Verrucomicrobiales bacterium]